MTIIDVDLATEYTFSGLVTATHYVAEVRARNAVGASAWVPVALRTLVTPGPIIDVDLATEYTFTGLKPETDYVAEVRARNAVGASAWVPVALRTLAPPPPDGPGVWLYPPGADTATAERVDFSCFVDEVSVNHGRTETTGQPEASSVTVDFTSLGIPADIWALLDIGSIVRIVVVHNGVTYDRFVGTLSDMSMGWDDAGADTPDAGMAQLVAVGALADMGRRVIGDEPFPQELDGARVARVAGLAGVPWNPAVSDPGTVQILPRDIDSTEALGVAHGTAQSAGGLLWQTRSGDIRYADADHRRGAVATLSLDACDILVTPSWVRNIDGLINEVSIGYGVAEEEGGSEQPRYVAEDAASIGARGRYAYTATTELAAEADATAMGNLLLARNSHPVWVLAAIPVDTNGLTVAEMAALLALDVHSLIRLTGLPVLGAAPTSIYAWVEGWRERLAFGVHDIEINISDYCRTVPPTRWDDLDPARAWDSMGAVTWNDAVCLPPVSNMGRWDDMPATTRWDQVPSTLAWDQATGSISYALKR